MDLKGDEEESEEENTCKGGHVIPQRCPDVGEPPRTPTMRTTDGGGVEATSLGIPTLDPQLVVRVSECYTI